ncbi:hypothetical protein Lesp02_84840 [Lentzea sp. NBRC 105346]|uniref:3-oxoacyl-ACP synthase III family protein n=1 Tax=Lentzea sp. NBRC 105346 TaxID=3032205 RepID=UPI0024A04C92|nr:3-oxoacyl-[acyl-carrier-protein] synthase III C-terminal domain-containing protein [Lentzea sp. NBRC 105346]GLZ36297.1 hypothetical protein Lesp02_84840 [Lentzea sp. NBRC 105346]
MAFGLVGFGTALGERVAVKDVVGSYTEDVERVLGYGYDYVHIASVGLTDLAVSAGTAALASAGVSARDVDLLVLAVADVPEYLYWDAAAAVAHRLGVRAEAVLISQGCVGGVTLFDTVAGRFATHPSYKTALVIGASRVAEAYMNRFDTNSLLFSDGAAAAVCWRDALSLTWRASHAETDGAYADFFRMDVGGAASPFSAGEAPAVRDAWDIMAHFSYDTERFAAFAEEVNDRTARAVHRVCRQAGLSEDSLSWLLLLNDNPRVLAEQADLVGVPLARTNLAWAVEHGHFGAADHLFGLSRLSLSPGESVVVAANGRGMHWAAALFTA